MLKPIRFLMIGGFLGAGKTTAICSTRQSLRGSGEERRDRH